MAASGLKLSFEIARVHLLSKPKQTIIAMLGVTFGIAMFIALVGLMTGLNDFTEEITMTSSPDIHIYKDVTEPRKTILEELWPNVLVSVHSQKPKNEMTKVRNASRIVEIIRKNSLVRGVAPALSSQVFYNYGPVQLNGTILGVDILQEDKLFDLKSKMKNGRIEELLANREGIIMGSGIAKKLDVKKNDRVVITTPEGYTMTLKVVGIFQMGIGVVDNVRSYANISTVQTILQQDASYITDINIKLKDRHIAKNVAQELQSELNTKAEDWETANATFLTGVIIRNIITYAVSVTLLIVAGFGIYNILNMTIYNKMKDIAILKAMGFAGGDVKSIFIIQSLIIGLVGAVAGLIIGYGLSVAISKAPFNGGDIVSLDHFPVNFDPKFYVIGVVFGIATTAIAGYMPSRKASKIDPIEILRGQ
ncbi:MAG: ABC transporter, permease protein [Cytophagales bacterium]|jgi:lipoprotein-releasing system permease protein|nr:ABC transporter permease [Bacteroidota bacterium]MBS1980663.1 ABC transporter permease [Bacteroidota bacterium]WHZ07990.1 MAG: ABC transporter, permease protein [Cytophagales bacterium]